MRRVLTSLSVAAVLALPTVALGQPVVITLGDHECTSAIDPQGLGGELYAIKLPARNGTDILWDVQAKDPLGTFAQAPGAEASSGINISTNWAVGINPGDVVFVFVTFPEGTFGSNPRGNWIAVDSGIPPDVNGAFGTTLVQRVGDTLKTSYLGGAGPTTALDMTLPGTSSPVSVNLGAGSRSFPLGAAGGIEVVFGAVADLSTHDIGGACTISGSNAAPATTAAGAVQGRGYIVGYNVYRMAGTAGVVPTRGQLGTIDNWEYYIPYSGFDLTQDDTPGSTGGIDRNNDGIPDGDDTQAPSETTGFLDLAGVEQPRDVIGSARASTGDEIVIFQDSAISQRPRVSGTGPDVTGGTSYWYAFQPVIAGSVASFVNVAPDVMGNSTGFAVNGILPGTHTVDMDGDTVAESVTLDFTTTGNALPAGDTVEFFSPQAELVPPQPGLGLTNGGLPVLSAPVFGTANPAASLGQVTLNGTLSGNDVNLTFGTMLEPGNVAGFNVYRVVGDSRVRVNDSLILARGGEGNVYSLVDVAVTGTSRRVTRGAGSYVVEVVYNDGTTSRFVGPFSVGSDDRETGRRR